MKKVIILLAVVLTLPCCTTGPNGEKRFLNRDAKQWGDIGFNTGKRTIPIVVDEYNKTATK